MKRLLTGTVLLIGLLIVSSSCDVNVKEKHNDVPVPTTEDLIKRGRYLTTIGGCNDCHSPKVMTAEGLEPDTTRLFSGHPNDETLALKTDKDWVLFSPGLTAFVGPWGVSYAANLTPDDTGIGSWTFEQFKRAIREGKYKGLEGSRPLMPPMPRQMYRSMTDDDLKAVFTYLRSLPPVDNLVPSLISPDDLQSRIALNQK